MNAADTYNSSNPLIKDSVLGSKFFNPDYLFDQENAFLRFLLTEKNLEYLYIILSLLAIFFLAVIIYVTIRMFEIRKKEHEYLHHEIAEYAHNQALREKESQSNEVFKNPRWKKVLDYLVSINENDWKLAIIEADLMLFDLLVKLEFNGESLGDKLKEANLNSFPSLNIAWEVHNIRNKIAHEGSSFEISSHEAKRVIALYEQIFREFGYI
ncbi:MAG: hypothetical protein UR25_C0005G0077 [Candidatus Nomurabacteria bacterium GW2011_GWE1_32_28]|uniref:Uncharacterized protein n=1 Tax=Candidatus Nomurabacteria bacterium GW2011_GWF1_31_48 TaxID=1618767 RepID=A0A0G0AT10_9BACT|nr:MAG: hypothetical protein UR10_C0006G0014 [Candidatus Nomurabacteria bacterium GW2011_GWF2_30_133]KKP28255.1 MAG: hypothetical protein UR18_C0007G0023 [Candidatus Nomurabacteria bacterium GW2011_GWE2_31_40]KKP29850.1 MAG: hypothetical protein UR19_C0007G0024 [Candidatus Nomurabacteria bacterium GW2011_GWF1_31_48]KKP34591.1 MAG: hypothetical protein UR25_C0005G0077 [Candidatus Nomurabacteria bacterium GW2011_GWE1_32_28]HAS80425.1 hypothetical protein [Candidatus Nomurabacteria bacterium]